MNILDILGLDTIWSTMESRRTKRNKRNKKKSVLTLLNWGLFVVYSVSAVFLAYSIYRYQIFNFRNLNHFLVGAMAVLGVVGVFLLLRKKAKNGQPSSSLLVSPFLDLVSGEYKAWYNWALQSIKTLVTLAMIWKSLYQQTARLAM